MASWHPSPAPSRAPPARASEPHPDPPAPSLPTVGTAGDGCGRVPALCPALGVIVSP